MNPSEGRFFVLLASSSLWAWGMAIGWLTLVFLSIPTAPLLMDRVKTWPHYSLGITLFLALFTILLLRYVLPWRTLTRWRWLLLMILLVLYGIGFWIVPYPVERFHFLQYGALAFFFAYALLHHFSLPSAVVLAFLFSSVAGYLDEILQSELASIRQTLPLLFGWLPDRYYSRSDILLNVASSALGLVWLAIFPLARPPRSD